MFLFAVFTLLVLLGCNSQKTGEAAAGGGRGGSLGVSGSAHIVLIETQATDLLGLPFDKPTQFQATDISGNSKKFQNWL